MGPDMLKIKIGGGEKPPMGEGNELEDEMRALDILEEFLDTKRAELMGAGEPEVPGEMSEEEEREILQRG